MFFWNMGTGGTQGAGEGSDLRQEGMPQLHLEEPGPKLVEAGEPTNVLEEALTGAQEEVPGMELFTEVERVQPFPVQGVHWWTRPRIGKVPANPRLEGAEVLNFQGVEDLWKDWGVVLRATCEKESGEIAPFPIQVLGDTWAQHVVVYVPLCLGQVIKGDDWLLGQVLHLEWGRQGT